MIDARMFATSVAVAGLAFGFSLSLAGCGKPSVKPRPKIAAAKSAAETLPVTTVSFEPPQDFNSSAEYVLAPRNSLTFNQDVAPIVLRKCAECHHPGAVAPFSLLTYSDVKKRAQQIVDVTERRIMPPWSPLPGYVTFAQDQGLNRHEIGLLKQWADEGAAEGQAADLPAAPVFSHGRKYGEPDLVVSLPEAYRVPAESTTDVYRKFVISVPINRTRYVRGFDFDPGPTRVIHHMRLRVDQTGLSKAQDQQDPQPGFDGTMFSGDTEPDGFFLVWTPGYEPAPKRADVAWTLQKGMDLVLELHLHPTGKEELVQPKIALYFQETAPRERLQMVQLSCETIDIPAGKKGVQYQDHFVLPVDTTLLAAMPHAHYLATEFRSWAVLPDGKKLWLMRIADWDFNWQREYGYAQPISLPKGTTLCMQVTYDNSVENPRNPHHPPQRVLIGRDTFNEMAQIFFQVLPTNPADGPHLLTDSARKDFENNLRREKFRIEHGQGTSEVHFNLASLYALSGKLDESLQHYQESIRLKPDNVFAVNNLGSLYRRLGQLDQAIQHYRRALEINPQDFRVHFNLGLAYLQQGHLKPGTEQLEAALQINPELAEAWEKLGLAALQERDLDLAEARFERALQIHPDLVSAKSYLTKVRSLRQK